MESLGTHVPSDVIEPGPLAPLLALLFAPA
jgi:hypothetical protein